MPCNSAPSVSKNFRKTAYHLDWNSFVVCSARLLHRRRVQIVWRVNRYSQRWCLPVNDKLDLLAVQQYEIRLGRPPRQIRLQEGVLHCARSWDRANLLDEAHLVELTQFWNGCLPIFLLYGWFIWLVSELAASNFRQAINSSLRSAFHGKWHGKPCHHLINFFTDRWQLLHTFLHLWSRLLYCSMHTPLLFQAIQVRARLGGGFQRWYEVPRRSCSR